MLQIGARVTLDVLWIVQLLVVERRAVSSSCMCGLALFWPGHAGSHGSLPDSKQRIFSCEFILLLAPPSYFRRQTLQCSVPYSTVAE